MTRANRNLAVLALVAAGAFLAAGCGSNSDCNVMPDLRTAPSACSFPADSTVTVKVRWCSCSSSIECVVTNEGMGQFQAEPKVNACDASCDTSGSSCGVDVVPCVFRTPTSGSSFTLYVRGAQADGTVSFDIAGSNPSCG